MNFFESIKRRLGFNYVGGIILYYHRVLPTVEGDVLELAVSEGNFREQLTYLGKYFDVISLGQLLNSMSSGFDSGKNKVVITFDDGYVDNLIFAAPILEKFNFPAVFFAAVNFMEEKNFWWETVDWERSQLKDVNTVVQMRKMDVNERNDFIIKNHLEKKVWNETLSRPMTWEELITLSKKFTIGSHACSHLALTSLSREEMYREILESKQILEKKLNQKINFFSYPYGDTGFFNEDTKKCLIQTGYSCALTTIPQFIKTGDSPFTLGRVVVRNENGQSLMQKIMRVLRSSSST